MRSGLDLGKMGAWLRRVRENQELSLREIARRAGFTARTVSRMEEGESAKLVTLERVAEALGVSMQEVLLRAYPGDPAEDVRSLAKIFGVEVQAESDLLARLNLAQTELREAEEALERQRRKSASAEQVAQALVDARTSLGELDGALSSLQARLKAAKIDEDAAEGRALLENPGLAEDLLGFGEQAGKTV